MRNYKLGLKGESNYQPAIRRCRVGMPIELVHEPKNKFDKRAICAKIPGGEIIGYAPRESWVQRAMIDEEWTIKARIFAINGSSSAGNLGVVLEVIMLDDAEVENRVPPKFSPLEEQPVATASPIDTVGQISSFFSGILTGLKGRK